jgi:hypothetical protein
VPWWIWVSVAAAPLHAPTLVAATMSGFACGIDPKT